jgi:hypothetical protein
VYRLWTDTKASWTAGPIGIATDETTFPRPAYQEEELKKQSSTDETIVIDGDDDDDDNGHDLEISFLGNQADTTVMNKAAALGLAPRGTPILQQQQGFGDNWIQRAPTVGKTRPRC